MIDPIRIATLELAKFLNVKLSMLSPDWWPKHVVQRLSFQQQRLVQERGHGTLQQLDLAALLRVLDQNWNELSNAINLPRDGRTWVKELQTVRNKWAHQSAEAMPPSDIYRDADTLYRFLVMIDGSADALGAAEATKTDALSAMTTGRGDGSVLSTTPSDPLAGKPMSAEAAAVQGAATATVASAFSHRARCKVIEDQVERATNDKIKLMKQSELARANADFGRRMNELQQAASSGDIHAAPVLFATISVNQRVH